MKSPPTYIEINIKTAKVLGLDLPASVLARRRDDRIRRAYAQT
jgi:hypothetical protein